MKKGFTLIEVIAAIAIFSIAFVAISLAFSVAITTGQGNNIRQNNLEFSETIIEKFKISYSTVNTNYTGIGTNGVSGFIYFNANSDLENEINGIIQTPISGNVDNNSYPTNHGGYEYAALINVSKVQIDDVPTYHIYVRSWRLDKGSKYQSIKDFYESR